MLFNYSGSEISYRSQSNLIAGCIILVFFLSVSSLKAQVQSQPDENIIAVVGATVIDGTGDEPTDNGTIVIKEKKLLVLAIARFHQTPM